MHGVGPQELKAKCSNRLNLIPLDITKSDQVSAATHLVASTLKDRSIKLYCLITTSYKNILLLYLSELWAVVNNAGVSCSSEIEWCPINIFENVYIAQLKSRANKIMTPQFNLNVIQMLNVNALGPVRVTKAFLPLLRESQGRIVFVTSLLGKKFA